MGAVQDKKKKQEVYGIPFDATKFMDSIFATIDSNRSDVSSSPSQLVDNSSNMRPGSGGESRFNCFLRFIGMPATRDESLLSGITDDGNLEFKLSQNSTLNYFNASELDIDPRLLSQREFSLSAPKTTEDFIRMIENPLLISSSVQSSGRRTTVFPLVVDASVPIYPLSRRTAPLFYEGDFLIYGSGLTRLPRPFLESVIYMRTQRYQESMKSTISNLVENIRATVSDATSDETQLLEGLNVPELSSSNEGLSVRSSVVELEIVNKFVQALKNSAVSFAKVIDEAASLNEEVNFKPNPVSNPKEKSGNSSVIIVDREGRGIDKRIQDIEMQIESINVSLSILPTNKVQEADTSYRLTASNSPTNISPDVFVSEFTDILAYEIDFLRDILEEEKALRARTIAQFEEIKKQLMYFTGEIGGLSIFDVLCIFLALFTVDLKYLIGLLNNDAKDRLRANRFFSFQKGEGNSVLFNKNERTDILAAGLEQTIPVSVALAEFDKVVQNNYLLAQAFFADARKRGR